MDAKKYHEAMVRGDTDTCIRIEQKHGLFGYPPEMVSVSLKAADEGKDVNQAIEEYING